MKYFEIFYHEKMKHILGYNLSQHSCDSDSEDECTFCYDKFAFVSIDENLSPNDTSYTIYITSNVRSKQVNHLHLFAKDNAYEVENTIDAYPGYNFTIRHIMKTENNECCDVEYKPLLMGLKTRTASYQKHILVSKLKSKYKIDAYIKSFENLVAMLTSQGVISQ